jgi:hypothetical protein
MGERTWVRMTADTAHRAMPIAVGERRAHDCAVGVHLHIGRVGLYSSEPAEFFGALLGVVLL